MHKKITCTLCQPPNMPRNREELGHFPRQNSRETMEKRVLGMARQAWDKYPVPHHHGMWAPGWSLMPANHMEGDEEGACKAALGFEKGGSLSQTDPWIPSKKNNRPVVPNQANVLSAAYFNLDLEYNTGGNEKGNPKLTWICCCHLQQNRDVKWN